MGIFLKYHEKTGIAALCDAELIGRVLEEDERVIDLDLYKDFYMGEIIEEKDVKDAICGFSSINAVGKESVGALIKAGLVSKENIIQIEGVPHIQVYKASKN